MAERKKHPSAQQLHTSLRPISAVERYINGETGLPYVASMEVMRSVTTHPDSVRRYAAYTISVLTDSRVMAFIPNYNQEYMIHVRGRQAGTGDDPFQLTSYIGFVTSEDDKRHLALHTSKGVYKMDDPELIKDSLKKHLMRDLTPYTSPESDHNEEESEKQIIFKKGDLYLTAYKTLVPNDFTQYPRLLKPFMEGMEVQFKKIQKNILKDVTGKENVGEVKRVVDAFVQANEILRNALK